MVIGAASLDACAVADRSDRDRQFDFRRDGSWGSARLHVYRRVHDGNTCTDVRREKKQFGADK